MTQAGGNNRADVPELVTVIGGSGFIGRHVVRRLAAQGARVRVAVRDPNAGLFLKTMGEVGQIDLVQANLRDDASVARVVDGAQKVVISVGLLYEKGRQNFENIHVAGVARIARAARQAGVRKLVHLSALGADEKSPSAYGRSKARGEAALRDEFAAATILRPSVVFGVEDNFINRLAALSSLSPVMPVFTRSLFDRDGPKFQPVFVGDVADAVIKILNSDAARGETLELGGPDVYSWRQIIELVLRATGRRRLLVPIPLSIARIKAFFLEMLPTPPLTRDQLRSMEVDNVVSAAGNGFGALGISPTPLAAVAPGYLARFRRPGLAAGLQVE
jgi:NADH dehydrogenase